MLGIGALAGCGGTSVRDSTAPAVVSTSPSTSAATLLGQPVSVTFSEAVYVDSFTVTSERGTAITGTVSGNGTNVITFNPSMDFNYNTKYTARVVNIRDGAGNRAQDLSWTFSTSQAVMNYHITPDSHFQNVGKYNSIAMSPLDGRAYMSYYNSTTRSLYVIATMDGYTFDGPYLVDSPSGSETVGMYSSLAIDVFGALHISYYRSNVGLMYATAMNVNSPWFRTAVDDGGFPSTVGTYTSIALDGDSRVHIGYYDSANTALKYATNRTGIWVTETVDTGLPQDNPGMYSSIKVDEGNVVHITYYDYHASVDNGNLKYVFGGSGAWSDRRTLDSTGNVGEFSSLALYGGKVYVTYNHVYPDGHRFVRIITNASGAWQHRDIVEVSRIPFDPEGITANPLFIDPSGLMHISYYKGGVLYYATGINYDAAQNVWDWTTAKVVDDSQIGHGIYTSLVVDAQGKARIAYYDDTDGDLKYAQ